MDLSSTSLGLVVRDNSRNFVVAKVMSISSCLGPHRAELLAAKEVLLFVWDLGIRSIHLEGTLKTLSIAWLIRMRICLIMDQWLWIFVCIHHGLLALNVVMYPGLEIVWSIVWQTKPR